MPELKTVITMKWIFTILSSSSLMTDDIDGSFFLIDLYYSVILLLIKDDIDGNFFLIPVKDMSHVMRKPVYAMCEQQRRRSACASAQSDQRLYCSLLK